MSLDVTPNFARIVLKPALGGIECISQGYINTFGMVTVNHDLAAWHTNIDTYIELLALSLMFVRHFNHYAARHDVIEKFFELFYFVADVCIQSFRMVNVTDGNLQWG